MVLDDKGKQKLVACGHKNPKGTKFCAKCGDPLGTGSTWDCNKNAGGCGKQNIPINSQLKEEFCPECGTKRPPLPRASLMPEDVKRLKKDAKLAKKGKRICSHCDKESPVEFNFCMHCDKEMTVTPSGAPLSPAVLPPASDSSQAIVPAPSGQLAQASTSSTPKKDEHLLGPNKNDVSKLLR